MCVHASAGKLKKLSSWYKSCGEEFEKFADNLRCVDWSKFSHIVISLRLLLDTVICSALNYAQVITVSLLTHTSALHMLSQSCSKG